MAPFRSCAVTVCYHCVTSYINLVAYKKTIPVYCTVSVGQKSVMAQPGLLLGVSHTDCCSAASPARSDGRHPSRHLHFLPVHRPPMTCSRWLDHQAACPSHRISLTLQISLTSPSATRQRKIYAFRGFF